MLVVIYFILLLITFFNIINLVTKNPVIENINDFLTFVVGIVLSLVLFSNISTLEYKEPIVLRRGPQLHTPHTPIASEHIPTVLTLMIFALVGYLILRIIKDRILPIITVVCISAIYIGIGLSVLFIVQLCKNIFMREVIITHDILYMTLFTLNYILCSIRLMRQVISLHIKRQNENKIEYKNNILRICQRILSKSKDWYIEKQRLVY